MIIPAPSNLQLRWVSSTMLQASWDPPPMSSILGYKIYFSPIALTDMERWSSLNHGPSTVALINDLESHTSYVVRVKARSADGKYSNFSEIATADAIIYGKCHVKLCFMLKCGAKPIY